MTKRSERGNSRNRLKKKSLTVYLDEPKALAFEEVARRTRIPKSELMREAVDLLIDHHSPENMFKRFLEMKRRSK